MFSRSFERRSSELLRQKGLSMCGNAFASEVGIIHTFVEDERSAAS
jgi:hypothetical protein